MLSRCPSCGGSPRDSQAHQGRRNMRVLRVQRYGDRRSCGCLLLPMLWRLSRLEVACRPAEHDAVKATGRPVTAPLQLLLVRWLMGVDAHESWETG